MTLLTLQFFGILSQLAQMMPEVLTFGANDLKAIR